MEPRSHQTVNQITRQQVARCVQAQVRIGEQLGGARKEGHGLVGHQKRLPAGQRDTGWRARLCSQVVQLTTPREGVLAPVGEILLVGIEAEEAVAMAVVRQGKTAAHTGAGARLAGHAHGPQGHARSAVADARSPLAKAAKQALALMALTIVRGKRHTSCLEGGHMLRLNALVQRES